MKKLILKLDGFTIEEYSALILKDELNSNNTKAGMKMGISRNMFRILYIKAKAKADAKSV